MKKTPGSHGLLTRRTMLKTAGGVVGGLALSSRFPTPALAKSMKKVTIVYGVKTIESASEGYFSSIPTGLGFYRDEGLDVEIQTVGGSSAALNLLASGQAQCSTHGTAGLFSGVAHGIDMLGFDCEIPDYFVSVGVAENSPYKTFEDLKGKVIGTNAQGGSPELVMRAVFNKRGWKEGTDYTFLSVGTALPALNALQRDRVQALVLWDTIFASFEFQGQKFRYFRPDPIPQVGFTHTTNALRSTMKKDPEMIGGLTRAINKAIVYQCVAPPNELTKLHFKVYPESKPTGMSTEDALRLDELRQKSRLKNMRVQQRIYSDKEKIGDATDDMINRSRDVLVDGHVIPKALPASDYFTRQFLDFGNSFDKQALIAKAKAFRA